MNQGLLSVEGYPRIHTSTRGHFSLTYCCEKKFDRTIKCLLFFLLYCFHSKDHPRCLNWTLDFEPAFSQRFYSILSPRSFFPPAQRFPILKHVTSGFLSLRSFFPPGQRFPLLKTRDFRFLALPVTSGSGDVIDLLSTNQKPGKCPIWAPNTTNKTINCRSTHVLFLSETRLNSSDVDAETCLDMPVTLGNVENNSHRDEKRPSHVKLMLANSCCPTQIVVCERHNNMLANCWRQIELVSILPNVLPTVCQHVIALFTYTNLSLPTRVGQH